MSHTSKVLLNCDIECQNKIIFENKQIYFYANVSLSNICWDGRGIDCFDIEDWYSDDEIFRDKRPGYLYTLNINDWCCNESEVEDFDLLTLSKGITFLVKSEEFEDIEIDYEMFEPDWDSMREGK